MNNNMDENEEWEDEYDENLTEAIRVIARNLFICVEELKDAGYSYRDFE